MSEKSLEQLNKAIQNENIEAVRQLLAEGVGINRVTRNGTETKVLDPAPLILAARQGHLKIVRLLLQSKAEVDGAIHGRDERTALFHAINKGHPQIVRELIKAGAYIDRMVYDIHLLLDTPLGEIVRPYDPLEGQILREAGTNVDQLVSSDELVTPLCIAARAGNSEMVRLLLEAGADVNALLREDAPAVICAIESSQAETARQLLEVGASPPRLIGVTPL